MDGAANPADEASRGVSVENFLQSSRWTSAPEFLWKSEDQWPKNESICSAGHGRSRSEKIRDHFGNKHLGEESHRQTAAAVLILVSAETSGGVLLPAEALPEGQSRANVLGSAG